MLESIKRLEDNYNEFIEDKNRNLKETISEIKSTKDDLEILNTRLAKCTNVDEYKELSKEISEQENNLESLENFKNKIENTKFDYVGCEKEIIKELNGYLENKDSEIKELCQLIQKLHSEICDPVDEATSLVSTIYTNETKTSNGYWEDRNISNEIKCESRFFLKDIVETYYYMNYYQNNQNDNRKRLNAWG